MLTQQDVLQFNGFGQGPRQGKYFYSSGLKRTDGGITPAYSIKSPNTDIDAQQRWLVSLNNQVWSTGFGGNIYAAGTVLRDPTNTSSGNGLIVDQKNRLLYAQNAFLGMMESAVWTDSWKTLSPSYTGFRPMELFEDMVLIGNKNLVAALFTSDDSITNSAFSLPSEYAIRCIKAGATGVLIGANHQSRGYLVLWDGRSLRSTAPWIYLPNPIMSIAVTTEGLFIVTTTRGIYRTNGYSIAEYADLPVNDSVWESWISASIPLNIFPAGTTHADGKFYLAYTPTEDVRHRFNVTPATIGYDVDGVFAKMFAGVYVYTEETGLWERIDLPHNWGIFGYAGALLLNPNNDIELSYGTRDVTDGLSVPSTHYVGTIFNNPPLQSVLITEALGQGNNPKYAEAVIANINFSPEWSYRYASQSWTITTKIYDFKRQLYGFGVTNTASSNANEIQNYGSIAKFAGAKVGDEITILSGVNAGQIRHITGIVNAGTSSEKWTLDSALPNLTEADVWIQVMPFKTIGTKNITEAGDYFFNIQNRVKGKKFLIKFILSTPTQASMMPELSGVSFIYDDNPTQ